MTDHCAKDPPAVIPLNDLKRQTASMHGDLHQVVIDVLDSGRYVLGPNVSAFEKEFAAYCGTQHCIGLASGTDALELALRAIGCGHGSEVITVANAGMYAAAAVCAVGASPVFVDIDPTTMTMSAESLHCAITDRSAAIIVTHLYGRAAAMDLIADAAAEKNVPLIEDCAQAHGAEYMGRKVGNLGIIGAFSFYPTKNLGALGDGGAIVTNDVSIAERILSLRQYGWTRKYEADLPFGRNSRLDELQAAILRLKLPKLDKWNATRRRIATRYRQAAQKDIEFPTFSDGNDYVAHLCVAVSVRRTDLQRFLAERCIESDIHYPVPDHRQRAMERYTSPDLILPNTVAASEQILTLPCFPEMDEAEIQRVCDAIQAFG